MISIVTHNPKIADPESKVVMLVSEIIDMFDATIKMRVHCFIITNASLSAQLERAVVIYLGTCTNVS
jgi:hypothetical protein